MAWIVMDLDNCLVNEGEEGQVDPMTGEPVGPMPVDGALEACMQLTNEGHRITVHTSRFAPMPDSEKQRLKEQIEQELASYGFPPIEVWTGTTKPDADIFIGPNNVTFDQDWNLVLAQTEMMLSEKGMSQQAPQQPGMEEQQDGGMGESDGAVPPAEGQPADNE